MQLKHLAFLVKHKLVKRRSAYFPCETFELFVIPRIHSLTISEQKSQTHSQTLEKFSLARRGAERRFLTQHLIRITYKYSDSLFFFLLNLSSTSIF